jgi:hypothetical protein
MENECLQRTNDSHDMMKNISLQNETLSATFKVKKTFFFFYQYVDLFDFRNK